jgi:hypothetical protein
MAVWLCHDTVLPSTRVYLNRPNRPEVVRQQPERLPLIPTYQSSRLMRLVETIILVLQQRDSTTELGAPVQKQSYYRSASP